MVSKRNGLRWLRGGRLNNYNNKSNRRTGRRIIKTKNCYNEKMNDKLRKLIMKRFKTLKNKIRSKKGDVDF